MPISEETMRPWGEVFEEVKQKLGDYMVSMLGFTIDSRGVYCKKLSPNEYRLYYHSRMSGVLMQYGYEYFERAIIDDYIRRAIMNRALHEIDISSADREWFEFKSAYRVEICDVPDVVDRCWAQIYEWVGFQKIYVDPEELRAFIDERRKGEGPA